MGRWDTGSYDSPAALAKLVRSNPLVICRLEDADKEGHPITMLRRIAAALGCHMKICLIRAKQNSRTSPGDVATKYDRYCISQAGFHAAYTRLCVRYSVVNDTPM